MECMELKINRSSSFVLTLTVIRLEFSPLYFIYSPSLLIVAINMTRRVTHSAEVIAKGQTVSIQINKYTHN